jgi:hypothetical protein
MVAGAAIALIHQPHRAGVADVTTAEFGRAIAGNLPGA